MEKTVVAEFPESIVNPTKQKNWIASVCNYFRDFLDTDFKKSFAPKRSIKSRDSSGLLTGVALVNYPDLNKKIIELLSKSYEENMVKVIEVRRGKYLSPLNENLLAVIKKQVESISIERTNEIKTRTKESFLLFNN